MAISGRFGIGCPIFEAGANGFESLLTDPEAAQVFSTGYIQYYRAYVALDLRANPSIVSIAYT